MSGTLRRLLGASFAGLLVLLVVAVLAARLPADASREGVGASSPAPAPGETLETLAPDEKPAKPPAADGEATGETTSRFGRCTGVTTSVDELTPTIKNAIAGSDFAVVAAVDEIASARYNTDGEQMTADDTVTEFDVYRPTTIRIETVVKGASLPDVLKVRLPGGQIGCDDYFVERSAAVAVGGRYVLFLARRTDRMGKAIDELTVVRAWVVNENGDIVTPYDGEMPLTTFTEQARN